MIDRWFFGETTGYRAAALRISFGIVSFMIFAAHLPGAELHFSDEGWYPRSAVSSQWTALFWSGSALWAQAFFLFSMALAVSFTLGVLTPLTAPLLCFCFLSVRARNVLVTDGTDWVILQFLIFLVFSNPGARWALGPPLPKRETSSLWPLRMLQIEMCLAYFIAGVCKLLGIQWWNGTALSVVLMNRNYARWDMSWVSSAPPLVTASQIVTWLVPLFEITFPFLVFWKKTRRSILVIGLLFHLGIAIFLKISVFPQAMIASYFIFMTEEEVRALGERVRKWVQFAKGTRASLQT